MDIKIHKMAFVCPKCDHNTSLRWVEATADGEISFYGYCKFCDAAYQFASSCKIIMEWCFSADLDEYLEACKRAQAQAQPRLLLPPPDNQSDDEKFLRDFHIEPPKDNPNEAT